MISCNHPLRAAALSVHFTVEMLIAYPRIVRARPRLKLGATSVVKHEAVFKLTIEESENSGCCRVVAKFDSFEREIEVQMLPTSFRESLRPLQEAILQSPAARNAQVSLRPRIENITSPVSGDNSTPTLRDAAGTLSAGADERMVHEIGSQLFDFIFQRKVLELYAERYEAAKKDDQPLSIRLHVKHPGLSYVPWEMLYDKANRFYVTT